MFTKLDYFKAWMIVVMILLAGCHADMPTASYQPLCQSSMDSVLVKRGNPLGRHMGVVNGIQWQTWQYRDNYVIQFTGTTPCQVTGAVAQPA